MKKEAGGSVIFNILYSNVIFKVLVINSSGHRNRNKCILVNMVVALLLNSVWRYVSKIYIYKFTEFAFLV